MARVTIRTEPNSTPDSVQDLNELREDLLKTIGVLVSRRDRILRELDERNKEIKEYQKSLKAVEKDIARSNAIAANATASATDEWREVLFLKDGKGLTWVELGNYYGVSPSRARSLYDRARRYLSFSRNR